MGHRDGGSKEQSACLVDSSAASWAIGALADGLMLRRADGTADASSVGPSLSGRGPGTGVSLRIRLEGRRLTKVRKKVTANGSSLTSISFVNRLLGYGVGSAPSNQEIEDGSDQERRIKARVCSNGPGQAARDREQGRQGEPRWRPQAGFSQPLSARNPPRAGKRRASLNAARRFLIVTQPQRIGFSWR